MNELDFVNLAFKGLDLGSGKRDIDLKKENKKLSVEVPQLVSEYAKFKEITPEAALEQLGGGKGLTAVKPERKEQNTLSKVSNFLYGTPEGAETELIDGRLVAKNRPEGIGRFTTGLADTLSLGITDYDKRGGGFLGLNDVNSVSGLGVKPTDYKLSKTIKDSLEEQIEGGSTNPVDSITEAYKAQMEYEKAMDPFKRKGRVLDAAIESANFRANLPYITQQMKDLSTFKQRQLLDAERIKQGLPNAQQSRLLAADTGFAAQAGAIAGQQDAATRFAGLGTQRRFG